MASQAIQAVEDVVGDVAQKVKDLTVKAVKPKKEKKAPLASNGRPLELEPKPEYLQYRMDMFDKLKKEYDDDVAQKPREPITVTLPDGKQLLGTSWETSPLDIAKGISKSLSEKVVIAKVDGQLWDLPRPLEKSCQMQLLTFEDHEGQQVYWHSSAHVLGEACELHYGCHLCLGPPIEEGFYYEMGMEGAVNAADYPALETLAKKAINEKQPFERLVIKKETLLEMFKHNKYKQHFINDKVPDNTSTTVYRCGPLIDLCVGPHIPHTGRIKAFAVMKNSSSYFLADAKNDSLQRVYGISFPDNKQMTEYKKFLEEAARRDHRKIGTKQELFFFDDLSPGSCFFLPAGARIYNKLMELQRGEYRKRGFHEVITPNMYNTKLWETSGHWQNYSEDMFVLDVEKERWALKPMNCPGHCVMFRHRERSYRELPLRLADFGVLHRNEASGALSGLTRVRRFQQDDAHIFCTLEQLGAEIDGCLEFLQHIYGILGFEFHLKLSTRPEKYLGEIETWNNAEKILEAALVRFGKKWELNPGDGAFYGPKIDIVMTDALRRKHQCATMQLDFQLPQRFELQYRSKDMTYERPVMIHRAILGSVERFIAILTENFEGKWPFWLSPKQILVIPVVPKYNDYAQKVTDRLFAAGFEAECDASESTLKKKIALADLARWNFIFVVGEEEEKAGTVNARNRDDDERGGKQGVVMDLEEIIKKLTVLMENKTLTQSL
ncbi:hypothetical protein DFS34DRAFT_27701 [Phlyctochytrium arcticum]|nr:hypothetical protein DFS34DRAFT_27701 [Phlyctochytrium arcticum]